MKPVCVVTVERLAEYLAGELDATTAAEMRAHLDSCATCRAEEAELAPMFALLAKDAQSQPDPGERYWKDFAGRVRTTRAAHERAKPRWAARLAWAASLAAVVALAVWLPRGVREVEPELEDVFAEGVSLESLDADELAHVEERLLAAERKKPTPTPAATPVQKREIADDSPGHVYDEIVDLDDLSEANMQELLKRIEAIRT